MKKFITLIIAAVLSVCCITGCGTDKDEKTTVENIGHSDSAKLSIVTTIFPEYDWVREILGEKTDNAELTLLLDNGVDLHNYQPTADDIKYPPAICLSMSAVNPMNGSMMH